MTKSTTQSKVDKDFLVDQYIREVLTGGNNLSSVFAFTESIKIKESEFYAFFNSLESLEKTIWVHWFSQTVDQLTKDEHYKEFSVREKVLAFYYTWFEQLLHYRSFVLNRFQSYKSPENIITHGPLKGLKTEFEELMGNWVKEGETSGEIPSRKGLVEKAYPKLSWYQFMFLMHFWRKDESDQFSETDAAIEKSVNLGMDFIATGPVDSLLDFAKFMYAKMTK